MINKYVFIQVRTSSKRLFGKCLFKIKGKETILLLFNRIKSNSYKTIILTSKDKSDDYLVKILKKKKIPYFRGSLNDVRDRFLKCSKSFNNNDIIVRCTADNLFIDKVFIKDLLKKFIKYKKDYITIDRKGSKLPYGLAAEVFSVNALRKFKSDKQKDLEHVTPAILRHSKNIKMIKIENDKSYYHLSCTMDEIYDYFKIKYIFENYDNKILTSWKTLCQCLKKFQTKNIEKIIKSKFNKIVLGTAQLGSNYGINNSSKISSKERMDILNYAHSIGINFFDTASSYQKSELKIGEFIKKNKIKKINVITKFSYPKILQIKNSLKKLNISRLYAILIHNPKIIFDENLNHKILKKYLVKIKKECVYIGASLNDPKELIKLKAIEIIKFYQIPFNILDRRWHQFLLKKKNNERIYVRSIFLQGLLLSDIKVCPTNIKPEFKRVIKKLQYIVKKLDRFDVKDLLIAYVNYYHKIDKIVIGVDNMEQLRQLPFYFLRKKLIKKDIIFIEKCIPKYKSNLITPQNWK
jgi:spore coat polysaccharide biosynthesis protein SpsF (cytidylyltransferase family)/aryl-alcohol dehydrogenase-like predicted oxidoreductase